MKYTYIRNATNLTSDDIIGKRNTYNVARRKSIPSIPITLYIYYNNFIFLTNDLKC